MTPEPAVLVVEDDSNDRELLGIAFRKACPHVRLFFASDGEEAIAYLAGAGRFADRAAHPLPRLVLLDLKLPRKSGFEVLEWVRNEPGLKELAVFVLTSSAETRDIERAYAAGANSYFVKSVDVQATREFARGVAAFLALLREGTEARKP